MAHKTFKKALLAGALTLAVSGGALAGASATMLADTCAGCHGTEGISNGPATPTIAGLSEAYFVETMQEFASGDTFSTVMGRIAKGYTEDELKTMAGYFASHPYKAAEQASDPAQAESGAKLHDKSCEKCHSESGTVADDDSGFLKGQWRPYLAWTLSDFQEGRREAPKKMRKKLKKLVGKYGDKGVDALLNYYASGK